MQCVEVDSADKLDSADLPLPMDGDELSEPLEGATNSARRTFLVSWSLMRRLRLPHVAGLIDQARMLCRSSPDDSHELLAERCRQDLVNTQRIERSECEAGHRDDRRLPGHRRTLEEGTQKEKLNKAKSPVSVFQTFNLCVSSSTKGAPVLPVPGSQ